MSVFFGLILTLLAIFLILLVLVQRGRGGGLAGALGGMGGSSAFGAKAGDVFTRITVVVVAIWITFCILAGHWAKHRGDLFQQGGPPATQNSTSTPLPGLPMPPLGPAGPSDGKTGAPGAGSATVPAELPDKASEAKDTTPPASGK
jgi:preprotein translocase subunit SecG